MIEKNKIKTYMGFVVILFVGVLFFSFKDDYKAILTALGSVNILWLILGIAFVFLSKYFIGLTTYHLAKKENKNVSMKKMQEIALIYPFFAGITPSSVGGEAFEVFYLKDCDISYGGASNISMQKFILYQIALIIVNFLVVILNAFTHIVADTSFVGSTITLNFIVNIAILGGCFLITYNRWIKNFILKNGVNILGKMRIIKDPEESRKKIDDFMDSFDKGARELHKDKRLFWELVWINILSLIFLIIPAWPIARAMHISNISLLNLFILATYAKMMCLLMVTPGNSGAAEYCFIYLFTGLIEENDIMANMLIWRFVTYYIPLIVGGVIAISWGRKKKDEKTISTES